MSNFPGSPKLIKGALVAYWGSNPTPKVIAFQINPESLARTLEAQTAGGGDGSQLEALRLTGAPVETIKLDAVIDATDQLDAGDPTAQEFGIYPQLALLELLLYPTSTHVITNEVLLALGTIEVIPPQGPLLVFVWGEQRVMPVRLTEFSVTEEFHDPQLNPIRAKVSLGLRVLSYNDLPRGHKGYSLFLNHQIAKEGMAKRAPSGGDIGVDNL
jgi:hypothetical protein